MLIRLKPNQFDYFFGLDPFEFLEGARNGKLSCIGAVAQKAKKGSVPVGLMIYDTGGKDLTVLWLYIAPLYRRQGIGEQLLQAAFLQAQKNQADEVSAILRSPAPFGWDSICGGAPEYLKRHLFVQDQQASENGGATFRCQVEAFLLDRQEAENYDPSFDAFFGEIRNDAILMSRSGGLVADGAGENVENGENRENGENAIERDEASVSEKSALDLRALTGQDLVITVGELSENKFLSQPVSKQSRVCPVGDLTLKQLQEGIASCLLVRTREGFDEDLKVLPVTWYETEVSSCVLKDGKVTALLLIHRETADTLWVEYLCAGKKTSQSELLDMMRMAVKAAVRTYPPKTRVVIRRHDEKILNLTEKLFS